MREEHAATWLVEPLKCKAVGMVAYGRAPLCCILDVHSGCHTVDVALGSL